MATFRPSGISVKIREDLVEGAARTQTTLNIDPIITKDGTRVTMAHIGDIGFAKIDQGTSNEEIISFTGITDNTDTYQLTGCVWGYYFHSTGSGVTANKKKHVAGASFIITNDDHFLAIQYGNADGDQTIAGVKTFTSIPKTTGGNPTDDTELARKAYVDATATGSATYDQNLIAGDAGETVAAGEVLYLKEADGEWYKADASASATCENLSIGIAQGAGTDGNAISGGVLVGGLDKNATYTAGSKYYISDTAGALATSAGTVEVFVGTGDSNNSLVWEHIVSLESVTSDEKDALAGTSGTPSTSNKYVTEDDVSDAAGSGKIVRATGTALPALDASNLTGIPVSGTRLQGSNFTAVTISNSTTETTLFTTTVAADALGTDNLIKFEIPISQFNCQDAFNLTLRLKYGSTTIATIVFDANTTTNQAGKITGYLANNGDAAVQYGYIDFMTMDKAVSYDQSSYNFDDGTGAEDSTGALALTITAQFDNASANENITVENALFVLHSAS